MVISKFSSKTVFLDTAPLIYFIEGNSEYQQHLKNLFTKNDEGDFYFITSTITLLEVLVKPLREGAVEIAQLYRDILLKAPFIEIIDMSPIIAEQAANLRARYNLKTPDAIQLATCLDRKADYFLTNDIRLKNVIEVTVVTVDELK